MLYSMCGPVHYTGSVRGLSEFILLNLLTSYTFMKLESTVWWSRDIPGKTLPQIVSRVLHGRMEKHEMKTGFVVEFNGWSRNGSNILHPKQLWLC